MTASRWLSALKKYTIKLVQECSMPKLYFSLLFLFWSASFHLASANNHEASLCRVSHFSKYQPTGRGTRELDLPDGGGSCTQITKLKLHCVSLKTVHLLPSQSAPQFSYWTLLLLPETVCCEANGTGFFFFFFFVFWMLSFIFFFLILFYF